MARSSQAAMMETHGLPNDVLSNFNPFALIFIPVFDIFVRDWHSMWDWNGFVISLTVGPALRGVGINFSPLKKTTAGFFATWQVLLVFSPLYQSHFNFEGVGASLFGSQFRIVSHTRAVPRLTFVDQRIAITYPTHYIPHYTPHNKPPTIRDSTPSEQSRPQPVVPMSIMWKRRMYIHKQRTYFSSASPSLLS